MADPPVEGGRRLVSYVGAAVAVVFGALSLVVLAAQVEVAVELTGADVTRACGSALDGVVDRTGWEAWWAADLAEPDDQVRDALVRTTQCPDAVNNRIAVGVFLLATSMVAALAMFLRSRHDRRRGASDRGPLRLRRLGRATAIAGSVLTAAGVLAVVWLVADADSTLFLYTDRFVVAVVGLIVLVPAIALVVAGWAMMTATDAFDGSGDIRSTKAVRLGDDRGVADEG